jgi:hypothetical protein
MRKVPLAVLFRLPAMATVEPPSVSPGQDGEVLQAIWSGVRITSIVDRDPIVRQIDPQAAVGEDGVARHAVA